MVGSRKLQAARLVSERAANFGVRYTSEELRGITGLSLMTLAKIFPTISDLQISVDKKTLDRCFRGFDSILEHGDYAYIDNTETLLGGGCDIIPLSAQRGISRDFIRSS
jgi:hypothetical protein